MSKINSQKDTEIERLKNRLKKYENMGLGGRICA